MNWAFWRSDKGEGSRARGQPRSDKAARESDSERVDEAAALRVQARRRLIGAAVLLLATAAVVPLILDPLPRAVPDSVPIEVRSDRAPDKVSSPPRVPVPLPDPASLQGAPPPDAASASEASPQGAPGTKPAAGSAEGKAAEASSTGDASADTKRVDPSGSDPKAAAAGVATVKAVADTAKPRPDAKPEARADAKTEAPSDPKSAPKSDATRPAKSATKADAKFAVQAAAPRSEQAARELMAKLKSAGLPAFVERTEAADGPRWRVRVGPYPNRADAERARTRLRELGHGADLVAL
jgi:DedD protein